MNTIDGNIWSEEMPSEPGVYEFRCKETDGQIEVGVVTLFKGELWITDENVGFNPLKHFHDGLTKIAWRRKQHIHTIPFGNKETVHVASLNCWCQPSEKNGVVRHNASDCREKFERRNVPAPTVDGVIGWLIVRQEL